MNDRTVSFTRSQEVHLWLAKGYYLLGTLALLEKTLDTFERAKAAAFYFEKHRARYVFSHGVLREILARYIPCKPGQLQFDRNPFGKPFLPRARWLNFNMSHSEDMVIVAVTPNRPIGVDLEFERAIPDMDWLARHHFSSPERVTFEAAYPHERQHAFFTCWSRKEAYIKAIGKGLSISLASFDVTVPAPELPSPQPNSVPADSWQISNVEVSDGYVGAVAVLGDHPWIKYKKWGPAPGPSA